MEHTEETPARETRDERKRRELEEKIDQINGLRGLDFDEVVGYCYREVMHGGRQTLPPLENVLMDHEIGLLYGPGRYLVLYEVCLNNGDKVKKSIKYNIGPEYAKIHRDYCQQNGLTCYLDQQQPAQKGLSISDFLTEDKAKSLIALLGAVKMIMGGSRSESDDSMRFMFEQQNKTLNALLTNKPGSSAGVSDLLISEAFKMLTNKKESNPLESMRLQMDLLKDFQGIVNPQPEPVAEGPMDRLIEKALEILPVFLQQHNGNIEKAAAAARKQNPMIQWYLKNKDAQRAAYSGLVKAHGVDAANRWARSFGLDPSILGAVEVTPPKQANQAPGKTNGVKIT